MKIEAKIIKSTNLLDAEVAFWEGYRFIESLDTGLIYMITKDFNHDIKLTSVNWF